MKHLERAIEFYEKSPDGQYDGTAAAGLALLIECRALLCRCGDGCYNPASDAELESMVRRITQLGLS